jgi:aminopeptidase N
MRTLTRAEAQQRAALLTVTSYDVQLDLTGEDGFASVTEVRFGCREAGATTFAELDGELVTAELNGTALATGLLGNRLALPGLQADNVLRVVARSAYSRTGEGLHRFVDPADGRVYVWGQSFLDDAQRVFACFDQPDLKAVLRLTVLAPDGWTVVGNTRPVRDGARWVFAPTERLSTYLFTVAAGPWHGVRRTHDGVELGLWCRQSLAEHLDADELFEVTTQCFDLAQQLYGRRYPFGDSYDQLFVPESNHGGMENAGAVTYSEDLLFRSRVTEARRRARAVVLAHELSHMWFGDLVTMRWWDDLWLNESFAELLGVLLVDRATRFRGAWVDFCASRKAWGYRADQLPTTHPVIGTALDTRSALLDFDGISYAKGASVLRQLMATVGEEAFFAGVRAYLARHAFGSTCFADLLGELETAAGRPLGAWARAWLQTPGVNLLRPDLDTGRVLQECPVPPSPVPPSPGPPSPVSPSPVQPGGVLREHRIGVAVYDRAGQTLRLRERHDLVVEGAAVALPITPRPDLLLLNDGDLTFAKLRFDDRSLRTVLHELWRLRDPLARALCWAALWDATRDGELAARDLVGAVLASGLAEPDPGVVETLTGQARTAADLFTADGAGLRQALAEACWQATYAAEPGSDGQLARLRAAVASSTSAHAGRLEGLLSGTDVPPGVALDADLRWQVVTALAVQGALGEDDLDGELARDRTAQGRRSALVARAARPDPAAKERAFALATQRPGAGPSALSGAEVEAVAEGFWQPGQDALGRPFVERCLAVLPELWRAGSPQVAQSVTRWLYPRTLVDPEVLALTDALLGRADLPRGLRRTLLEQRDDLARALRARAAQR